MGEYLTGRNADREASKKLIALTGFILQDAFGRGCDEDEHRNCFNKEKVLNVKAQGKFRDLTITKDRWYEVIDAVHEHSPEMPLWMCFKLYGICPKSIITDLSMELWSLYSACGGLSRVRTPADYYSLPAIYVDAVRVIENEKNRIEKIRDGNNQRKS